MILHSVEFTHVGRFRGTFRLGPLAKGVNLLGAPNEAGKTTTVRALARGLFDRHTTRGDEIKSLQPAGTELAPRIVVEFETAAGRFRIAKTFLSAPRSHFHRWVSGRWEPEAEGDAADQRVQSLLRSTLPGKGATRPEHWGMLGFLWAQQGAPAEWPDLGGGPLAPQLRSRLAQVELDPVVDLLRQRLGTEWQSLLTQNGRSRTGGALAEAEVEGDRFRRELEEIRRLQSDQESARSRHQAASAEVFRLEKEAAERRPVAEALREQLQTLSRIQGEVRLHGQALQHRRERLQALVAEDERRRALLTEAAALAAKGVLEAERHRVRIVERDAAHSRIEALAREREEAQGALETERVGLRRIQGRLQGLRLAAEADSLSARLALVRDLSTQRAALEESRNALPPITPAQLRLMEEAEETVRGLRAEVRALGLHVDVTAEAPVTVFVDEGPEERLAAGESRTWARPQETTVRIPGWGRIRIRSGAQDAAAAAERLALAEARRKSLHSEAGTASLDAARAAFQQRRELELRIEAAVKALRPHLGDFRSPRELQEAAAKARLRADSHRDATKDSDGPEPTLPPIPADASGLEELEATQAGRIAEAERRCRHLETRMEAQTEAERRASREVHEAATAMAETVARQRAAEAEAAALAARHTEGPEAALNAAKLAFAEAEGRLLVAEAALPPDAERLPDRVRRAFAAIEQVEAELTFRRAERDEAAGRLEALGGQGLYSRETATAERLEEADQRLAAVRTRAVSARLLHALLERRKSDAIRAVLAPLEDRLSRAFAEISGEPERRIHLDEDLAVVGVGRRREEAHPFGLLSQGGREQLLLCLRLAVAEELAAEEPQVLVLDDALVNTDPARLERIHGLLESRADRIQVLLLTCHADRYRGLGRPVAWSGPLEAAP